jgi:hypothetical protein
MLTLGSVGVGVVTALLLFRVFFRGWGDFGQSLERAFRGMADFSFKAWLWILCSVGSGFLAYYRLPKLFPHLFA